MRDLRIKGKRFKTFHKRPLKLRNRGKHTENRVPQIL